MRFVLQAPGRARILHIMVTLLLARVSVVRAAQQATPQAKLRQGECIALQHPASPTPIVHEPAEMAGPEKAWLDAVPPAAPAGQYELLSTGHRRVTSITRVALEDKVRAALTRAGKSSDLDPVTGERIVNSIVDYVPQNWGTVVDSGIPVDSLGRPIVNDVPGLPGWAQADVDALRSAIQTWIATRDAQAALGQDLREIDGVLGNYIGQAIVRGVPLDDLLSLDDPTVVSDGVAQSIIDLLHFYENLRFVHADGGRYVYQTSVYPANIIEFVAAHGRRVEDVLQIETAEGGIAGGQPSGCYARTAFARGMITLVGPTNIWVANGFDDEQADISTGFPLFFFYDCQNPANNDAVRVSTNGYIALFEQGGGAIDGTDFSNDPIPDATDPDGYVAAWWDDLIVATSQGSTDRVSYKTEGAVDSRVFTVEYASMSRFDGDGGGFHWFQVKLFETIDVIELHIGLDSSFWFPDAFDNATCGIENYNGAGGDCGPNCLNTNSQPPPNDYRFTPTPRPDNDNCGAATELINGASVIGNLHRATPDGAANCGASLNNRDVWYTFVARCNGTLHLDTCGSRDIDGPESGIDTVLSVHSGCPGTTSNQLACNDDAGAAGCSGNDSAVAVAMVAGQRVFIRITQFGDLAFRFASGVFRLNLNFTSSAAPANNDCSAATPILNGNTLIGSLLCASNDGSADCGSSATNPDIWYRFTAGASTGALTLSLCGSRNNAGTDTGPDTVLTVYSGCPGTIGNEIACNDDGFTPGCNTLDSRLTVVLNPNQTVAIRVSHFGSNAFRVGNGITALHADFGPCLRGDSNCDGHVDNFDVDAFVLAIGAGQEAWEAVHPCNFFCANDIDRDGAVTNFDVDPFVLCLSAGGCP